MAANVEGMMFVGATPWHGLGTKVDEAPTSADAIVAAGLDWRVEKRPIYVHGFAGRFNKMDESEFLATVRMSDSTGLGIVSKRYQIVQNVDAFNFTDILLGNGDIRYETAGSLDKGRKIWVLARMPESKILDDKMDNYLVFTNGHDGKNSVRVAVTPVRVVCQNTLNLALQGAHRIWSTKHVGSIEEKMQEAKMTLQLAQQYQEGLAAKAEEMAMQRINEAEFDKFLETLFPVGEDATDRKKGNVQQLRDAVRARYAVDNLANFKNTAWGVINAVSDTVFHMAPQRQTDTYQENLWDKSIGGNKMLDKATDILKKMAA